MTVLVAAALLVAGAAAVLLRSHRPGAPPPTAVARRLAASPAAITTATAPTATSPPEAPTPEPAATPSSGSPPPAPAAEAAAEDAAVPLLTPVAMRQTMLLWKRSPNENRARRALEIARSANRFVAAHPAGPLAREIQDTLPTYLKLQATTSLDHAQPVLAHLYYRAYRHLRFAPPDAELDRRFESLQPPTRPRATPADPDGR